MSIIYVMLPIALLLGVGFLAGFIKMCLEGQYDDLDTPAHRILITDEVEVTPQHECWGNEERK